MTASSGSRLRGSLSIGINALINCRNVDSLDGGTVTKLLRYFIIDSDFLVGSGRIPIGHRRIIIAAVEQMRVSGRLFSEPQLISPFRSVLGSCG